MKVGGKYNWMYQTERLVYLGKNWSGNGYWHQFAKVENPLVVWCELTDSDLHMIEETKEDIQNVNTMDKQKLQKYVSDLFGKFLYYDRKEDDEFTLEDAKVLSKICTKEELIEMFTEQIEKHYK